MTSSNDLLDAALEYSERGFSVVPIKPGTKIPLVKWKEFQERVAARGEIESWWMKWPKANVGIVTGKVSGIYGYDADGPAGENWISEHLPGTFVYSKTSRGIQAFYRVPTGVKIQSSVKVVHKEVDVRGEGALVVVAPSIHQSGHKYSWIYNGEGWDDLEEYTPTTNSKPSGPPPGARMGNLNLDLSQLHVRNPVTLEPQKRGHRNDSLARLAGRWVAKGGDLEEVTLLAEAWNAKNKPPLDPEEVRKTIESIFKTHERKHPSEPREQVEAYIPSATDREAFPGHLLHPGGLIEGLMGFMEANSAAQIPLFSMAAAITFVGSIVGQKIMSETGLRTNLYCIGIGYSGCGKDAPHSTLPSLLIRTKAYRIRGFTEITSAPAILKWLSEKDNEVCFSMLDEFGHILKGIKEPTSHAAGIPGLLTKLYSGTTHDEIKSYASKKYETIKAPWHCLSIYGTSTPIRFWEKLTRHDFQDGFLARALIWETKEAGPRPKSTLSFDIPDELIGKIDDLAEIDFADWEGPPGNIEFEMNKRPVPHIVPKSQEAIKLHEEWAERYYNLSTINREKEDGLSAIYGRAAEHASKLALIHAVSLHGSKILSLKVEEDSMQWATGVVDYLIRNVITQLGENLNENRFEELQKRVVRHIRKNATMERPGLSLRDLFTYLRGVTKREMGDVLSTLEAAEVIFINSQWKPKNGPRPKGGLYCLRACNSSEL